MYYDQSFIIAKSSNMFKILKPLYILHTVMGLSSFKFHENKFSGVGKLQKLVCVLVCLILAWADVLTYKNLFKKQFGDDQLKNTLDFFCYLSFLLCVLISWIMAAFVNGERTIKMILNYCEVDNHLKVLKNLKKSEPLYLKILFFHVLTFLLVFTYAVIGLVLLYRSFARVWPFIFMLIGSLVVQKFVTEIYMIIAYIDNIIMKLEGYENAKSLGTVNNFNVNEESVQINRMMDLYLKLYENSCIANDNAGLPVIKKKLLNEHFFFLNMRESI